MRRLWLLVIRNWSASPGRTFATTLSVALGVAAVVIVTSFYETARRGITDEVVTHWFGGAHVSVHPVGAHWASVDASLADDLAEIENVRLVTARLRRRVRLIPKDDSERLLTSTWWWVHAVGIRPETESAFRTLPNLRGRMMRPGERGVTVMERDTADAWQVSLGDSIVLQPDKGDRVLSPTIVGLFDSQRVAAFQAPSVYLALPDVQELVGEPAIVSAIDLILEEPSPDAMAEAKDAVERCLAARDLGSVCQVETGAARQILLDEAQRITRLLLMLIAFVALLTSFFIILTTQSISLFQRRPQLGILRCLGTTRGQVTATLFAELVPLGVLGTLLGVLLGIAVTRIVGHAASDVLLKVYLSRWGVGLAVVSGMFTTLVSAGMLVIQVGRVTPLEAVNPEARSARLGVVYACGVAGLLLLALHHWMVVQPDRARWLHAAFAGLGAGTLHLGYALIAPFVVVVCGRPIAHVVGRLLRLRGRLAEDPFVRAPWRSTGACWVLMVGLSLIVYIAVRAEGVLAVWDFPARLPEVFVWSPEYVSGEVIGQVGKLPGVARTTTATDVDCEIRTAKRLSLADSLIERFLRGLTRPVFVAGEPDGLMSMIKVAFTEGSRADAMEKLRRGGYVLIPRPTARHHELHVGDRLTVTIRGTSAEFEVAGVVESPALDLAVTAFQAESYMQFAAASAILGTREDLKERFGLDLVSMFMCDVDLPPSSIPADFDPQRLPSFTQDEQVARAMISWADHLPNERETMALIGPTLRQWRDNPAATPLGDEIRPEMRRFAKALRRLAWSSHTGQRTREENWNTFRERLVLYRITQKMDRPGAIAGSLRHIKEHLGRDLRRAIITMTWLPTIILIVAAIGIGNLMMVSIHQRTRQIAVLRAVGAQKSQIVRLVLAEAITIGLLGSIIGLGLGFHEAYSVNRIAAELIDVSLEFIVPVGTVVLSVLVTVAVCLLAGVAPARRAARKNIVEALQTT